MTDMILKTKNAQEINLAFLNRSKGFQLGIRAGKEGWGQEGGAWQKNGEAFRLGWLAEQCLRPEQTDMTLPRTDAEIRKAIENDICEHGDARLGGEPTGIYFTFLIGSERRDFGYDDIYLPGCMIHFTMESVEWEKEQLKGSGSQVALIAFEPTSHNRQVNGTPLKIEEFAFWAFVQMVRWAKESDQKHEGRMLNGISQCIFSMMFAERILRKWLADGCPADGDVTIL